MNSTLTFDSLKRLLPKIPKINPYRYFSLNPYFYNKLINDLVLTDNKLMFGFDIEIKIGQLAPVLLFKDIDLFRKYLNDEILEVDLVVNNGIVSRYSLLNLNQPNHEI